jgi:hypothetical protein
MPPQVLDAVLALNPPPTQPSEIASVFGTDLPARNAFGAPIMTVLRHARQRTPVDVEALAAKVARRVAFEAQEECVDLCDD